MTFIHSPSGNRKWYAWVCRVSRSVRDNLAKFNITKRTNINLSFYLSNIQCTGQNKILQRPVSWNYFWPRSSEPRDMPPCHWLNFSSSSWVLIGRFCALLHNQTNSPVNWKLWQIHLHNQTNYPIIFPFSVAEILSIPGMKHTPAVLQNESHPHLHEKDLRDYCRINKVVFQVIWIL